MRSEEYEKLYRLERNFWWFKGMRNIQLSVLNEKRNNLKILDAGCGTGILMKYLQKYGEVHGIDISDEALHFCKQRGLTNLKKASVESLPYEENTFDIVTSIDIIYHKWVESDLNALKEMNKVLKKGGTLLIQAAAYNFMYSNHDDAVFTERRYTKKELKQKLEQAGFKVQKITYANILLFPLVLIKRLTEKKKDESEVKSTSKITNSILMSILNFESSLVKHMNFPYGLSIIAVAKKN